MTQDGAQPAPKGSSEDGSDRLWLVHTKTVVVLMACLLRARHCARPVHSPADSLLSTYCMPGRQQAGCQGFHGEWIKCKQYPCSAGGGPDGKAASPP